MPLVSIDTVSDKSFDYVILGGGTAGLVLAARLTEDPETSVLVLEAGPANLNDNLLLRPAQFGLQFGKPEYDWAFQTKPQKHMNGTQLVWRSGRGLGGGSGINLMCWTKPPSGDIDDLERLGNPGWNWKNYEKYANKAEKFVPLPKDSRGLNVENWNVGTDGPLVTAHTKTYLDIEVKALETFVNLGIPPASAPLSGDPNGVFFIPNTIDSKTFTRTYSTTAYFVPNADRPNLSVLVNANANKLVFDEKSTDGLLATGAEFEYEGKVHVAHAKKDVIVSAGTLKTPQILELSGIGSKEVLDAIDIPVKVELPGVGENLQEHTNLGVSFEVPDDFVGDTFDVLRNPEVAAKQVALHATGSGVHTMGITLLSFNPLQRLSDRADAIHHATKEKITQNADKYSPGRLELLKLQLERLQRQSPGCETILVPGFRSAPKPPVPGKRYITFVAASNHPFSRGTVHAVSADPRVNPEFDPHYFEEDIDLQTLLEMIKFIRKIPETSPFKEALGTPIKEYNPGPEIQTDEQIIAWLKKCLGSTFHPAGTSAMLPREKGGVVNPELKVYGTKNVRVVDLSILPLHFASHSQSSVYAIAEQAADIIKGKF
ncbi:Glucose oxidase [Hypsizygus marmoreus]|uniref:Glucose oxidase n=1 Tax=Hypsizygus marmoreus TaxID=39966 RepID=A0A369J2W3_HYPMA|nr:Glucose oxidase [Hypsizygus marmoreus]